LWYLAYLCTYFSSNAPRLKYFMDSVSDRSIFYPGLL
jgi:hypothetical protein